MTSAKLSFEINGILYTLYFGIESTRIFQERAAKEVLLLIASGIEKPTESDLNQLKLLANLIYSGLCNMADINDEQRPSFIDAYSLAEMISVNTELIEKINNVWEQSQPVKEMLDRLKNQATDEEKKSPQNIGKKSGRLRSAS